MVTEKIRTLNGQPLTQGQAMTLRVAIESFASDLERNGLGDDFTGQAITAGYLRALKELRTLIYA